MLRNTSKLVKSFEKVNVLKGEVQEHKEWEDVCAYMTKKTRKHKENLEACVEKATTTLKQMTVQFDWFQSRKKTETKQLKTDCNVKVATVQEEKEATAEQKEDGNKTIEDGLQSESGCCAGGENGNG